MWPRRLRSWKWWWIWDISGFHYNQKVLNTSCFCCFNSRLFQSLWYDHWQLLRFSRVVSCLFFTVDFFVSWLACKCSLLFPWDVFWDWSVFPLDGSFVPLGGNFIPRLYPPAAPVILSATPPASFPLKIVAFQLFHLCILGYNLEFELEFAANASLSF